MRYFSRILLVLTLALGSAPASAAVASPQHIPEQVRIPAGDAVLAGTLYRPTAATTTVPAIVLGHGSSPVTRERNAFWIKTALRSGQFAVLVFDKRGSGESTGEYEEFSVEGSPKLFKRLATDMVHAVRWLAMQPGIDRNRIGLMGGSQAGWIMPLAASEEPLVRFIIVGEGVPLPTGIEDIHGAYLSAVAPGRANRPSLRQMAAADELALDYQGEMGFDPAPVLQKLRIPVLWTFGLYDDMIPTRLSIHRIGELQKAGHKNHRIHIFPFADHDFKNVFTGERYDVAEAASSFLEDVEILKRQSAPSQEPASSGAQQILPGVSPAAAEANAPISAAEARETAAQFARLIEENYLYPDVAKKYAKAVRTRAARGEYDSLGTRGALAAALTKHVQAVFTDGHLKMWAQSGAAGAQLQMAMAPPQAQQGPVEPATPGPGKAIEEARWLAPGVAYIRFTVFPLDPAVTAAAAKFMNDHADAETVIFDVRTHKGGGMAQAAAMLPYLFGRETVFVREDTRASTAGGPNMPPWMRLASPSMGGVRTTESFVRPHPSERRLFDARVYVLTSGFTVSAGEAFAFGLKTTGRATLIGETTTGGGHFAPPGQRVNEKFAVFVPVGRAYDPRTGRGWERTGVAPDIKVPAERALVEALVRSGIAPDEAERLSASVHPQGPMRRPKQAS